jgi:TonB family protein
MRPGRLRRIAALLGFVNLFLAVPYCRAQNLDVLAKRLSQTLRTIQIRSVVVSDFVDEHGRVTVQGVLLSDKIWFALLADEKGFETLNRILLQQKQYSLKSSFESVKSFEKVAMESASAIGADVLITGVVGQEQQGSALTITALRMSTGEKVEQLEASIPSTDPCASLANQLVHPLGPIYLIGQEGVSPPSCAYCPTPPYSDQAREEKIEGNVVVTVVINSAGQPEKTWVARGLPDGLTEQAMRTIKSWRFKPARDAKGKPITLIAPVDVAFHL